MPSVADKLYNKHGGHNKFLESMQVWIDIDAPRYFWSEMDTYRVGMTKQSESTVHTILRDPLTPHNFQEEEIQEDYLIYLNQLIQDKEFLKLKRALPEGFLQRRVCSTNYMTLRNIIKQRKNHKLPEWKYFCQEIYNQIEYPEFMEDLFI